MTNIAVVTADLEIGSEAKAEEENKGCPTVGRISATCYV